MLVYHSPNSSDATFVNYLEESCINNLLRDNIIVMGDFNIDMKLNNHIQGKLTKVMNSVGLKQLIKEATRIVSTSETIIDLVFSNMDLEVKVYHEPKITDHSTVVICWNIKELEKEQDKIIVRRDYKRMDVNKFKEMIDKHLNAIEGDSINILANIAISTIINCLDTVAPPKTIVIKNKWQGKQWYTEYIDQMIKQRDKAYKTARISKCKEDWDLFRRLRNNIVDICRKAKRDYLEEKLDNNKKDPKQMWKVLKEVLKGNTSSNEYKELQCGNKTINNVKEMVNTFNFYFIDSVRQLRSKLNEDYYLENIKL